MVGTKGVVIPNSSGVPVEVACVASTAKTVLQIFAPVTGKVWITRMAVMFDGASPTDAPAQVYLQRQSGGGSGGTSVTPQKMDPDDSSTLASTAIYGCATEPGILTGGLVDAFEVHPQTGIDVFYPMGLEVPVPANGRIGIVCNVSANVNCIPKFWIIE